MTYQQALDLIQEEIIANGNNEITANVLRPVLEAMIQFPRDVIGVLGNLNTSDITSIVNAINSIVSQNLPNATALRPIDTTGVDFDQDELLWVRDAINNTATNNGAFTCSLGQQMVFYCAVLISNSGGVVTYQTRYYRLTTGAIIVNSLGTGLNPPLMPDGSTINTLELDSDLVIDLGNIGTDNVEDAFNSDGDQPFTILGDKFIQAVQNGDNKLWQWIGGDGTFGNSATLALVSYFVDLTSTTPPPSSIPKYEQIKGSAIYQSLTATPSIALNLNSFFYRYIVTDDDLEITFSNLPAPDYGFPRFIDLVIPATKVLTIPSADEIVGSVVADGTTVNRIELRFVYYPTVGLRIVAVINGGGSSSGGLTLEQARLNGNLIEGDILLPSGGSDNIGFILGDKTENNYGYNGISIDQAPMLARYDLTEENVILLNETELLIQSTREDFIGIKAESYYGANYTNNTYVQKKYVDDTKHTGISLYNATTTGTVNLDCATFDSWYRILTGNTDFTFSNTPASGETFVKTLEIITTAGETLDFSTADKVIGTFVNDDTTVNIITINFANYPTVGLRVTVMINS